jgi:hypothetical protein
MTTIEMLFIIVTFIIIIIIIIIIRSKYLYFTAAT